ncbi:MAG: sulfur carrier protein ThiS adenylyltransferase ThiF [Oscillospiraceae bacterium]|nr:sulfur carrier protein ThiS adenylyltransferase ThiF [Oscillospiraceae bacterium]
MGLTKEMLDRAWAERHGIALQQRFAEGRIAVCGLGGLGSHIAMVLARAGVGQLHLIDDDRVELSNLHRQHYETAQIGQYKTDATADLLHRIAPFCEVKTDCVHVTPENLVSLLSEDTIICEAFDKAESKAMLVDGVLTKMPEKYVVAASGMAGLGDAQLIRTRCVTPHFWLCGDEASGIETEGSLFATGAMLCAAHQAHAVLRILAGEMKNRKEN